MQYVMSYNNYFLKISFSKKRPIDNLRINVATKSAELTVIYDTMHSINSRH